MEKEMKEKLMRRCDAIADRLNEFVNIQLNEDMKELVEMRQDIGELILATKIKKISCFGEKNGKGAGFYLGDFQITFFVEEGEDEEGLYYEATAEIIES